MKNLTSRILSAIAALTFFVLIIYFFQIKGILGLLYFIVARGSFEYARMLFNHKYPTSTSAFFVLVNLIIYFCITSNFANHFQVVFSLLAIMAFVLYGIILHKKFEDISLVLTFITQASFGFLYTCFIPATVAYILHAENGLMWFFMLLAVVFAGDIGAYLFGVSFGKTKLAPKLSPNKSFEGSMGGLLFSMSAAYCFYWLIPSTPIWLLITYGFFGGVLGQTGDFFESLIKRVSGVKDSGSIMPGHGGILDRIDGVLLAAPLFYFASQYKI